MRASLVPWLAASALVGAGSAAASSRGDDWPAWRGPAGDGVSREVGWHDVGREAPLWEREVGVGHSSVAVVGGAVYTLGHDVGAREDVLVRLDLETGAEVWRATWPGELRDNSHDGGTLSTPTVAGGLVFVTSNLGRVAAYDAETGAERWALDAERELGLGPPTWGFASSAVVLARADGGSDVVVNLGVAVALDAATGAVRWRSATHRGSAYSTPAVLDLGSATHLAVLCGEGLSVLRAADGGEVAFHRWDQAPRVAPMTPVVVGDRLFVSAGYERGGLMLRLAGGALEPEWTTRVMRNKLSGCVRFGEHLYGFDEAILRCLDLSGQVLWSHRGLGTGALSIAGGRLVILDGKGQLVVALAVPTGYIELSRRAVFSDGTSWSTPVLAHGRVLCRSSLGRLVCLDHRRGPDRVTPSARESLQRLGAALPTADELFARHASRTRPEGAPLPAAARLRGRVRSLRHTARRGAAEVTWAAGLGFRWREHSPSTGAAREASAAGVAGHVELELGTDPRGGWAVGAREVAEPLAGDTLAALREGGDVARLFDLAPWYPRRAVRGVTLFDHRVCFVVAAATREGRVCTLYFEAETGLLAGQEGAGVPLWTYGEYADAGGGFVLPRLWATFDADSGEMTAARFDEVDLAPAVDAATFAPPPVAAQFFVTGDDLAALDASLAARFAEVLGEWVGDDEPADAPRRRFWVEGGFLQTDRPRAEPNRWRGPDERGWMVLIGSEYLAFGFERDAAGRLVALQVYVDGAPRTRLVRPRE